ncbi:reverse transcriptase-like protein [archaeon]|nr:MAG: reverse transcriptase-like protein [archaeon]
MKIIINTDGGCRFNSKDEPADASAAFVARTDDGRYLASQAALLIGTNNIAEYQGVYLAAKALPALLRKYPELATADVEFRCDAQLIVRQMNRVWAIKDPGMLRLSEQCRTALASAGRPYTFKWVPREENKEADLLCNLALDGKVKTDLFTAVPQQNKGGRATCGQLFRLHGQLTTPRPMRVDAQGYALCNGCGQPLVRCTCLVLEDLSESPILDLLAFEALEARAAESAPFSLPWDESAELEKTNGLGI